MTKINDAQATNIRERRWIACSEVLPCIPEEVELHDGNEIGIGFIWDRGSGGVYFQTDYDKYLPIWWRPQVDSAIMADPIKNTYAIKKPSCEV